MDDVSQADWPVHRFRLHGLRKLNWVERSDIDYCEHLTAHGFDQWIEPGPLAIVVGPNGGGKSTIIDLFRALADARLWPRLSRENYGGEDFSGFDFVGNHFRLTARFSRYTKTADQMFEQLTLVATAERYKFVQHLRMQAPKFNEVPGWEAELQNLLDEMVGVEVRTFPATGRHLAETIGDETLVALLNELAHHFPSVMAGPAVQAFAIFGGLGDPTGRIGVLFKDDPGQHSFVHRSNLPLGWLQLAAILYFFRGCTPGGLIVLDEPDRHLHPSLQRVLLETVSRERERLNAQVLLATHSSVLVNPELCCRTGARVIVTARGRCEMLIDTRRILDDLGVTSADLVQANGVIWVEGPSDRIYLKRWLELCATERNEPAPIESIHYAFVSYGGALLKHIGLADDTPDRVDLRTVNRNFTVVIDRDLSARSDGGFDGDKGRLIEEARQLAAEEGVWITERYTVESYLPEDWPAAVRFIKTDAKGRLIVSGIGKVELACKFANEILDWNQSFANGSDLPVRIAALLDRINAWQSPQEIIEPSY